MAIIEDYDAIAKRLAELQPASPKGTEEITNLEMWHDLARETARVYVENRRHRVIDIALLRHRPKRASR